jgi:hypothetical protein
MHLKSFTSSNAPQVMEASEVSHAPRYLAYLMHTFMLPYVYVCLSVRMYVFLKVQVIVI